MNGMGKLKMLLCLLMLFAGLRRASENVNPLKEVAADTKDEKTAVAASLEEKVPEQAFDPVAFMKKSLAGSCTDEMPGEDEWAEGFKHEVVEQVSYDGFLMKACLVSPKDAMKIAEKKVQCYIVVPGFNSNKFSYTNICKKGHAMDKEDVCILFPEHRELGNAGGSFTLENSVKDLGAWITYMKKAFGTEAVHLCGHGFGGAVVLEYAANVAEGKHCGKLVLMNTFKDAVSGIGRHMEKVMEKKAPAELGRMKELVLEAVLANFNYDSLRNIAKVDAGCLLVLHSNGDTEIPPKDSEELCKAAGIAPYFLEGDHNSIVLSWCVWKSIQAFVQGTPRQEIRRMYVETKI